MKKTFLILFCFSIFFTTDKFALATSGACSYHGGVNCSAEAYDGNAICNDGTESSVSFSDMQECQSTYTNPTATQICVAPVLSGYVDDSQCAGLQEQLIVNGTSRYAPDQANGVVSSCESQVAQYQAQVQAYQTCLNSQSTYTPPPTYTSPTCAIGYSRGQNNLCEPDDQVTQEIVQKAKEEAMTSYCQGEGATYDSSSDQCVCPTGYSLQTTPNLGTMCILKTPIYIPQPTIDSTVSNVTTSPKTTPKKSVFATTPIPITQKSVAIEIASTTQNNATTTSVATTTNQLSTSTQVIPQESRSVWTSFKLFIQKINPFRWI